jgi:sugar lactone lactonase YvrE
VYVADSGNNTIRKITPAGVVTTLAGRDGANAGTADGAGANARFNNPKGLAADSSDNLYVTDTNNHTIRTITPAGAVTTVAGFPGTKGASDGVAASARFTSPSSVAIDGSGNLYIVDTGNATIRKLTTTGVVSTIAGLSGVSGSAEGTGNAVRLTTPYGIAVDSAGNVLIADSGNNAIRKGVATGAAGTVAIQTQPKSQYVNVTNRVVMSLSATGPTAPTYQWRKNNVNLPGATDATYTIASAQLSDEASYTVVATSGAVSVVSSAAVLQVFPASVTIPPILFLTQPLEQSVAAGQGVSFVVDVAGSATPSFQWQKDQVDIAGATNATFTIGSTQSSDAGSYRVVVSAGGTSQASISAQLTVTGAVTPPPPPSTGRIINLSILSSIAAGGDNFTMGYVVGGSGTSGTKPLVIRAAGPSLSVFGVGSPLDDPQFSLFAGSTAAGGNDNWGGSPALTAALAAVGAFAFVSPTSKDAATTANISSRDNSVVVSSANSGGGSVLAEVYDATPSSSFTTTTPRLINVSVRKNLGTGLTVGFVLGGSAATKVLVRVVGPTLGTFGVGGVVADPQLTLFNDKSVKIGENNDWGGTTDLAAAFAAVGAFVLPATSKDAALVATLQPGSYSVVASGTAGTSGVALVEVYEVP